MFDENEKLSDYKLDLKYLTVLRIVWENNL